jgi:hypothetical protein
MPGRQVGAHAGVLRLRVRLLSLLCCLLVAGALVAVGMAGQAWAGEYVYKLHLTVKGTEEVSVNNGPEPSSLPSSVTQSAEWTWSPKDVDVVIPKYEGAPGFANEGIKKYLTFNETKGEEPIGKVENNGVYVSEPTYQNRISEPYTCEAPIISSTVDQHRVIVNALNPEIDLETVFVGSLAVKGLTVGEFGPCGTKAGQNGNFFFPGEEETGERMQVGMTINQAEIGSPLPISGPALEQSNVETSEKFAECGQRALGECTHKFKLSGEYELEPVCEGTLSVAHAVECAGGSGSSNNSSNNNPSNNNSSGSNPGGGAEAKKEEEKKAEEAAKKKRSEEEAKASVKIESIKLTSAGLQVKLETSEKGAVTIAGAGLTKLVAKTLPAGTHTARIDVSKKARAKHQKIKLTVSLKVGSKTVTASKKLTL